jgi:hypothetical protein
MKERIYLFCLFTGLFIANHSFGQNFTSYNMNVIPQRTYSNPAFIPKASKMYVGLPLLSSEQLSIRNSGFKYSDVIKHGDDDSLHLDFDNMISKLSTNNYLSINYNPDILSFGIVANKNFFSFNITEKIDIRFRYPKAFMEFLWKGNGAYLDKEMQFNFGLDFSHYREYALGYAREINDKLSVGAKVKYLYGMESFNIKRSDISLYTSSEDYAITAKANIEINSCGIISDSTSPDFSVSQYAFKRKNSGMGIDLGAAYKVTEKWTLSASMLDLGFINWKDNPTNYVSHDQNAKFTYNGFELNQLINSDSSSTKDIGKALGDSLSKIFKIDTLHKSYKTNLSSQIYLGANYNITEKSTAGVILYGQVFDKTLHPGIALSYNHQLANWINASATYSIYNKSYTNLGLGIALKGGPVQFYIVTDNLFGMIFPQNTKSIQIHFGINLLFGKKESTSETPATTPAPSAAIPAAIDKKN